MSLLPQVGTGIGRCNAANGEDASMVEVVYVVRTQVTVESCQEETRLY